MYDLIIQNEIKMKNINGNGNSSYNKDNLDWNNISSNIEKLTKSNIGNTDKYFKEEYILRKSTNRSNYLHIFLNFFENLSNLHVFLKNVTPFINLKDEYLV